jgi:hypothetical protein
MESKDIKIYFDSNKKNDNPLSGADIKNYFDGNIKILTYNDLRKYKNIHDLLYPYGRVCILYVWKNERYGGKYGHWVCLFINKNNNVEFFDPYGNFIDDFLNNIELGIRNQNGEYYKYLSRLLYEYDGKTEYNNKKLQSDITTTCGKWCVFRMLKNNLTIEQFNKMFGKNTIKNDNIILKLFL